MKLSPTEEVQVPSTVHRPLAKSVAGVTGKLRKLGSMVVVLMSEAAMGFAAMAVVAGPGSLMLCFGWMDASTYLPANPGVSASWRSGSLPRLNAISRRAAHCASSQRYQSMTDWSVRD